MMPRVLFGGLFLLAVTMLAGCDSKSKGTAEGDPAKSKVAAKGESPKAGAGAEKTPASSKGGKGSTAKGRTGSPSGTKGGTPIELPADMARLEHKAFVIYYKGFTEDQMKAYLDHLYKYWGKGSAWKSDGIFTYQVKLAKQNQGMRIVREDDFTRIMFPVEERGKNDPLFFQKIALPLWSLGKIDESVKGKVAYATCNEDCSVIYRATDKFHKR